MSIGDIEDLIIPVPPVDEQKEIVRRVQALFALAEVIEGNVEHTAKRTSKLTQAILAKAFRGDLVPTEAELARREGRNYEPASALLKRIKSEREKITTSTDSAGRRPDRRKTRTHT